MNIFQGNKILRGRGGSDRGGLMLVRVADHPGDAGQRGNFLRRTLGIAAGDKNLGAGILTMRAADRGAGVLIGSRGYGAGVEHHQISFSCARRAQESTGRQITFHGGAIGLRGAATKIFKEEAAQKNLSSPEYYIEIAKIVGSCGSSQPVLLPLASQYAPPVFGLSFISEHFHDTPYSSGRR